MCARSQNRAGSRPLQTAARRWGLAELPGEAVEVLGEEWGRLCEQRSHRQQPLKLQRG